MSRETLELGRRGRTMRSRSTRLGRITAVALMAATIVAGSYAFTAANTVPNSKAGDGSGTVSGYTVSAIHYGLNASSPQNVDSVTFTLDSTPAVGSTIKIVAGGTTYSCTNVTTAVTCPTIAPSQATVVGITSLRVIVAD
jgi:hypothetical protein